MPTRTATTRWTGDIEKGSGQVSLDSSKAGEFTVSFPSRAADTSSQTDPEELIAAAHATCFAMNLAGTVGGAGHALESSTVTAKVTLGKVEGGFAISGIALTVEASVAGVDDATFQDLAKTAESTCPVSKALAATPITLEATLVS